MSKIRFRHYKPRAHSDRHYGFCWTAGGPQPTFDIYWGKHTFVWFKDNNW